VAAEMDSNELYEAPRLTMFVRPLGYAENDVSESEPARSASPALIPVPAPDRVREARSAAFEIAVIVTGEPERCVEETPTMTATFMLTSSSSPPWPPPVMP